MSIGSEIRNRPSELEHAAARRPAKLSSNAVPYLLSTADAFVIVASSVLSGIGYQLAIGNAVPNILPHCAVGLLASFIHILRMSGGGYYDFPDCAKPRVEMTDILVCWFTTGLLLAFFAFPAQDRRCLFARRIRDLLLRRSRRAVGAFARRLRSFWRSAVSRGAIGRRDIVMIGDFHELAAIEATDALAFFGSAEVTRFTLEHGGRCAGAQ